MCRHQWNHQHPAGDFGAHQPVRWWFRRVEDRVVGPDVVQPQVGVLEQVCGLGVDLERVFVEQVEVEAVCDVPSV